MTKGNSWSEYRLLVLQQLEQQEEELIELRKLPAQISAIKVELQLKSGVWGLVGGLIPPLVVFIYWLASR